MPKPEDLLRIFGVILLSLASIGLVSRTAEKIFGRTGSKAQTRRIDPIYDPDAKRNESRVCPWVDEPFRTRYEESPCFGKTQAHLYVPWIRHAVWEKFRKENLEKRKREAAEKESGFPSEETGGGEEGEEETGRIDGKGNKETPSRVVYTIVGALLVASCTVACWEVLKDKTKRRNSRDGKIRRDRTCSLADFTINRHLRRESRQAEMQHLQRQPSFDRSSKVTQTLIHQGSLDRAIVKFDTEGKGAFLRFLFFFSFICTNAKRTCPNLFFRLFPPFFSCPRINPFFLSRTEPAAVVEKKFRSDSFGIREGCDSFGFIRRRLESGRRKKIQTFHQKTLSV